MPMSVDNLPETLNEVDTPSPPQSLFSPATRRPRNGSFDVPPSLHVVHDSVGSQL
ncbi:hypothetical protein TrRE_jg3310, partial [Triparma retinervis]